MKNNQLIEAKRQQADKLFDAGKFDEALKIYQELLKKRPKSVALLLGKAQCLAKLGEIDKALDILDLIISQFPDFDIAILFKAQFLMDEDRVQDAIQFLEGKINSGFNDAEGYALMGELYQLDDRPILAITAYNKALGFPTLVDRKSVTNNLANCYSEISNNKRANEIYDELLKINPDNVVALYNKASLLKEKNDSPECLKILLRVTKLEPEFLHAWILLGTLYDEMGADLSLIHI